MSCPCGTGLPYPACCGRWHAGDPAPTAAALMRSRYSAFALGDVPYLRRTWHRSTRPRRLELDPGVRWTGLEILASTESTVEFRATSTAGVLHERSRFVQEDGRWYYVDGELSP